MAVAGGAAGVSPQTAVKVLWDGATPTDYTPLGAAMVGVLGPEFTDIGPVEALNGRRWTEGSVRVRMTWRDPPGAAC